MNILIIDMFSNIRLFKKSKSFFIKAMKDSTLYFAKWKNEKKITHCIKKNKIDGIILSGSDYRIKNIKKRATLPSIIFECKIPILGICYGYQYLMNIFGKLKYIKTFPNDCNRIYTKMLKIDKPFTNSKSKYFFIHHDYIVKIPKQWNIVIKYKSIIYMAYNKRNKYIGVQFHPERLKKTRNVFFTSWLKYIRNNALKN